LYPNQSILVVNPIDDYGDGEPVENGSLVSPRNSVSKDKEVQKVSFVIGVIDDLAGASIMRSKGYY
jgi:hypothetical protein